jgi:DNA polymerase-1
VKLEYSVVTEQAELRAVAQKLHDAKILGFDIETAIPGRGATLDPLLGKIRLVQLNIGGEIFVLDLWRLSSHEVLLEAMRSSKAVYVIHNSKFEQKWFWHHYRFEFWPVFDTLRASGLLYNGRNLEPLTSKGKTALDLDSCVLRELAERPVHVGKGGSNWSGNLTKAQLDYAAEDVFRLLRIRDVLKRKLQQASLTQAALIEFSVVLPEATCELNGMPVDRDAWLKVADHHQRESRRLAEELLYELPHPKGLMTLPGMSGSWNLNSPDQLLQALRLAGCDVPDTSRNTLAMQAGKFEVLKKVLEHRTHTTRLKMFGNDWLGYVHPKTGRVHTSYYSLLASGRYSSSDPNLQQIPREKRYRACFKAPPGKVFVLADYSGIEMRLVAEVSGDERLIKVFQNDQCAHYSTASLVMQKPVDQITGEERQMAKPVNFGFCYGMREKTFVLYAFGNYGVAMTLQQAKQFRKRYFEGYLGVAAWHAAIEAECAAGLKMVRTMSGRVRFLDPQKHHNEFKNSPIQGTGADALKLSLRNMHDLITKNGYGDRVKILHHVHDEIILEVDDDKELIACVENDLESAMKCGMAPFLKRVPIKVDAGHGTSWAEAK